MKDGRPSWTARWVAAQRATLAATRPARGDAGGEARLYETLSVPGLGSRLLAPARMAARTRFFDRQVLEAAERGIDQVVVLGAGYDGRALRFNQIGARWIEVDHPASQADKVARLNRIGARIDHVSFAALDLTCDDLGVALDRAGHQPDRPTLWLAEGLLPYLPAETISSMLATTARRSAAGSVLAVNALVFGTASRAQSLLRRSVDSLLAAIGEKRASEFQAGDIETALAQAGWTVAAREEQAPSRSHGSHFLALAAEM